MIPERRLKKCIACGTLKTIEAYRKRADGSGQYYSKCAKCIDKRAYEMERKRKNGEHEDFWNINNDAIYC